MITGTRVVSALLTALLLAGPLVPIAGAQQPPQPPAPDLFQEQLRTQQEAERSRGAYDAGAVAVNVFLVPGAPSPACWAAWPASSRWRRPLAPATVRRPQPSTKAAAASGW